MNAPVFSDLDGSKAAGDGIQIAIDTSEIIQWQAERMEGANSITREYIDFFDESERNMRKIISQQLVNQNSAAVNHHQKIHNADPAQQNPDTVTVTTTIRPKIYEERNNYVAHTV